MRSSNVLTAAIVWMLVAACGSTASPPNPDPGRSPSGSATETPSQTSPPTSAPTTSASTSTSPSTVPSVDAFAGDAVRFTTDDGVTLEGRLFGAGATGVVLAHGNLAQGQLSWFDFARVLAEDGYLVLTFNFRGFCPGGGGGCSSGTFVGPDSWRDIAAAIGLLRGHGATAVALIGASLGGHSALWAAAQSGIDVAGVVSVSTQRAAAAQYSPAYDLSPEVLAKIRVPVLFLAGADDDLDAAADARTMYEVAHEPKNLVILPTSAHGAGLLTGPSGVAIQARATVLRFLQGV